MLLIAERISPMDSKYDDHCNDDQRDEEEPGAYTKDQKHRTKEYSKNSQDQGNLNTKKHKIVKIKKNLWKTHEFGPAMRSH